MVFIPSSRRTSSIFVFVLPADFKEIALFLANNDSFAVANKSFYSERRYYTEISEWRYDLESITMNIERVFD